MRRSSCKDGQGSRASVTMRRGHFCGIKVAAGNVMVDNLLEGEGVGNSSILIALTLTARFLSRMYFHLISLSNCFNFEDQNVSDNENLFEFSG